MKNSHTTKLSLHREQPMTAIHRRKMLGLMVGGALVATIGSMIPVHAKSALNCPAYRVPMRSYSPAVPPGVPHRKQCFWWGQTPIRTCCWRWYTPHGWVRLSPTAR
jgi:hypothetical protein